MKAIHRPLGAGAVVRSVRPTRGLDATSIVHGAHGGASTSASEEAVLRENPRAITRASALVLAGTNLRELVRNLRGRRYVGGLGRKTRIVDEDEHEESDRDRDDRSAEEPSSWTAE